MIDSKTVIDLDLKIAVKEEQSFHVTLNRYKYN